MNLLSILLSSGEGLERILVGALCGLVMSIFIFLNSKVKTINQRKKTEKLNVLFEQKIVSKGGLPVLFNDLFDYLKTTFSIDKFVDEGNTVDFLKSTLYAGECMEKGNIVVGRSTNFLIVIVIGGNAYDTLKVVVVNNNTNKRKEWEFYVNEHQQRMIEVIGSYLKSKYIVKLEDNQR